MKCIVLDCNNERAFPTNNRKWRNRFCVYHKRYTPIEWPCLNCNKNFKYSSFGKKYCDDCKKILNRYNSRKDYKMKRDQRMLSRVGLYCIQCGQQLKLEGKSKLYCSRVCITRWYSRQRTEKRRLSRTHTVEECIRCKTQFKRYNTKQKFCTRTCQINYNNKKRRRLLVIVR